MVVIDPLTRRQLGGVYCSETERMNFSGRITPIGCRRYGVTFDSAPKTTLSSYDNIRPIDCGIRETVTATNIVNNGSTNSAAQSTSLDISDFEDFVEEGDLLLFGTGADITAHYIRSRTGNNISVFPWIEGIVNNDDVKLCTGGGVYTIAGDSSLIHIDKLDGFRCGILFKNHALYLATVGTLHGNGIGVGYTIGRDNNAAIGGGVSNYYLEGGGNIDMTFVESSIAITGHTISSINEVISTVPMVNCGGANPGRKETINTSFLSDIDGADYGVTEQGPNNQLASSTSITVSNKTKEVKSYLRNDGTIFLDPSLSMTRNTGIDLIEVICLGTSASSSPTTEIKIEPSADAVTAGWTVNGVAALSILTPANAFKVTVYLEVANLNMLVFTNDLIKTP